VSIKNTLRKARQAEGGFTLIELLLVIVILGVLAAVVVLSVRGISNNSESAACEATQTAVITANEAYRAQIGSYPADTAALVPNFLTVGGGASVAGNTVTGDGWNFTFTPATSAVGACNFT
jgi:general secretion pathway protein G